MVQTSARLRFGTFEADLRSSELRKNGTSLHLPPQAFRVLVMLAERPGQMVSRQEIQSRVWSRNTIVDFEHSINTAIRRIREALNDSRDQPEYIETLPRRGYRFVAEVQHITAPATDVIQPVIPRKKVFRGVRRRDQIALSALAEQVEELKAISGTIRIYLEQLVAIISPATAEMIIGQEVKRLRRAKFEISLGRNRLIGFLQQLSGLALEDMESLLRSKREFGDFLDAIIAAADMSVEAQTRISLMKESHMVEKDFDAALNAVAEFDQDANRGSAIAASRA